MKSQSADGVSGLLLRSFDGEIFFRVYDANNFGFVDYDLRHTDLNITINDPDAFFYTTQDGRTILVHSPSTLGHSE